VEEKKIQAFFPTAFPVFFLDLIDFHGIVPCLSGIKFVRQAPKSVFLASPPPCHPRRYFTTLRRASRSSLRFPN